MMIRLPRLQPCQMRVVYVNCSSVAAVTASRRSVSSRPARHVAQMFVTGVKHRQETVCLSFSSKAVPCTALTPSPALPSRPHLHCVRTLVCTALTTSSALYSHPRLHCTHTLVCTALTLLSAPCSPPSRHSRSQNAPSLLLEQNFYTRAQGFPQRR